MNAESVKARLKNFAVSSGCTFQDALVYYGLERTIYRLSVSPYASHFVLKGGIFLYAIFDRKYERATTDVDLLARRISNSAEEMTDTSPAYFASSGEIGSRAHEVDETIIGVRPAIRVDRSVIAALENDSDGIPEEAATLYDWFLSSNHAKFSSAVRRKHSLGGISNDRYQKTGTWLHGHEYVQQRTFHRNHSLCT